MQNKTQTNQPLIHRAIMKPIHYICIYMFIPVSKDERIAPQLQRLVRRLSFDPMLYCRRGVCSRISPLGSILGRSDCSHSPACQSSYRINTFDKIPVYTIILIKMQFYLPCCGIYASYLRLSLHQLNPTMIHTWQV